MEMATDSSNLRDVFLQQSLEIANRRAELQGPLDAEVIADVAPAWYVLVTEPMHERIVAGHLVGRRFGIYLPEDEVVEVRRGRRVERKRLLLPGYVFVFVWDIRRHMKRLRSIPGAIDLLCNNEVPIRIKDADIDKLREAENYLRPIKITIDVEVTGKKKKKKRRRQSRIVEKDLGSAAELVIGIHPYSPFIDAMRSESDEIRIEAFHRLIGRFPGEALTESVKLVSSPSRVGS